MTDAATEPARRLTLSGCVNFRDLGGYPTQDGRRLRWRTLFRADGLAGLDADDCAQLAAFGLRTVIDLRTVGEVEQRGRFPLERFEVEYHHLPLTDILPSQEDLRRYDEPAFVTSRYHELFTEGSRSLAQAVRILAEPGALPAVFHCSAGKDRTGILAALVLAFLGVPRAAIVDDYALSAEAMVALLERLKREYAESADEVERYRPAVVNAAPQTMDAFLDALEDEHGSFDRLADTLGVTDAVARLREELLEPDDLGA
ncbi:MAG TPA: tyrosine-protein phosphatase [Acidimicrobiales bacterium]|nr:tyrosine-protein phosphatase [Acidimicrobiales bacterium]